MEFYRSISLRAAPAPESPGEFPLLDHALHSALFRIFPGSYILLNGSEQCLILNLSQKDRFPAADPVLPGARLPGLLPVCRDIFPGVRPSGAASGLLPGGSRSGSGIPVAR